MSPASDTVASGADSLLGLAMLGKTTLALALVIGAIFFCSWLLRRLGPGRQWAGQRLKVVSSTQIGPRERLVIVEVQGTWLVLGVTAQQISKLHELPAPPGGVDASAETAGLSFAERLVSSLKVHLPDRGPEGSHSSEKP